MNEDMSSNWNENQFDTSIDNYVNPRDVTGTGFKNIYINPSGRAFGKQLYTILKDEFDFFTGKYKEVTKYLNYLSEEMGKFESKSNKKLPVKKPHSMTRDYHYDRRGKKSY